MRRSIISMLMAIVYLAASLPRVTASADQPQQEIRALLQAMPAGFTVEIGLVNKTKAIGKIKRVTEERLILERGDKTEEYFISEIRSIQKHRLAGSDLEVNARVLGSLVLDEKIKAMTRDGCYIEGKVIQATEEALVMDVTKSEPKGRFRGQSAISTSDIGIVYMKKNGSIAAPVALGVIGGFLALLGSTYAAFETDSGIAGLFLNIGGTSAGAATGAYAGREATKKTITISVTR